MGDAALTKRILLYIEDNLDKELSLEKIAEEFGYSKFYAARTFKDNAGMTLHKYVQGRRLDEAARKLAETDQPIVEIALEAGYGSQQAFTQAFRRTYLCTPQEYRCGGVFIPKQNRIYMGIPGAHASIHASWEQGYSLSRGMGMKQAALSPGMTGGRIAA